MCSGPRDEHGHGAGCEAQKRSGGKGVTPADDVKMPGLLANRSPGVEVEATTGLGGVPVLFLANS